ncbi:MAG TPA: hypothetical protein VEP89_18475, partial [Draconibacterium sp.]|nr:hypothetical protein [Draconibacterium sp.]
EVKSANSKLSAQLGLASVANRGLSSDNSILKAMISDNYRTEALKGKRDKLTVVAKKTSKLMMSFDMPEIYSEKIYFKVVTPDGKEYSLDGDMIANVKTVSNGDGLMASIIPNAAGPVGTQRVEMTYQPLKKLSEGVYLFSIYNEDRLLGSTQLRLK